MSALPLRSRSHFSIGWSGYAGLTAVVGFTIVLKTCPPEAVGMAPREASPDPPDHLSEPQASSLREFARNEVRGSEPPEETRLSTAVFRAGLKKRGLTELLELHLKDFPPASATESLMMMREVKLAESDDPTRPPDERRRIIAEANRILKQVIQENSDDPRHFQWRFALAHSLLYDEAEPFLSSILYRGGSTADRNRLCSLSTRAVAELTALMEDITEEYERMDGLSIGAFEKLEAEGYVEQLDRLAPRADYLLLWAFFYDALPRDDADPTRVHQLNGIVERIRRRRTNSAILNTPHESSRVQVQALLLTGMVHRLLNNHHLARDHLNRALTVASGLDDAAEQQRVQWAVTLAHLERIRNEADDGRFDRAIDLLGQFRNLLAAQSPDNFGLRVVAALLERSIYRLRALTAERKGRKAEAKHYHEEAWKPLANLALSEPDRRDELYATIYELIGSATASSSATQLDPFEQSVLVAGLLFDANQANEAADPLLDRAIHVGERFLADVSSSAKSLIPEVLYNLGVAQYRRGRLPTAANRFLEVARDHPTFSGALQAAGFAAQLGAELYGDPSLRPHPEVQQLYRDALDLLVTRFPDTDTGRYWRFYYAQLLDELVDYDNAAIQYALVDPAHEHYLESVFARTRCLAISLNQRAGDETEDLLNLLHQTSEFLAAQRDFVALATRELNREPDDAGASTVKSLLAQARLMAAEAQVLPHIDRPVQALEMLAGFEEEYPNESAEGGLVGRVWRVRLLAYEKLGRLDEATKAIPTYIAADFENAGATLQSLYFSLTEEADRLFSKGDERLAQRKADLALVVAQQIYDWASRTDFTCGTDPPWRTCPTGDRRALTVQLAEANLRAGQHQQARELFEQLQGTINGEAREEASSNLRVVLGYAEALYQLGEFASALPRFNRLATALPPTDPVRWKSLLRDLQCRTALGQPSKGIIKVIQQQKYLHPDLGGPTLAPQFEKLQRENERRAD